MFSENYNNTGFVFKVSKLQLESEMMNDESKHEEQQYRKEGCSICYYCGVIAGVGLIDTDKALGHGYVSEPASRAKLGAANNVGSVQYEPQSLEAPKGFPLAGPADGKIASAGGMFGGILDQQSSDRWIKHDMVGGVNDITWYHTAQHRTTKWHYYITKKVGILIRQLNVPI